MMKKIKKIVLVIGPPGSGKTSVSDSIKSAHVSHFSIGGMYREIAQEETPLGKSVKENIDSGKFVPLQIANDVLKTFLEKGHEKIIIDGFPRSMEQAEMFDNLVASTTCELAKVIEISVERDMAFQRISDRKRGVDDRKELFDSRMELYETDIQHIRDFYAQKKVFATINGNLPFEEVANNLQSLVLSL